MINDQEIQNAKNAEDFYILHSAGKANDFGLILYESHTKMPLNENNCYLHSGAFLCILESIKSNKSNKNKELGHGSRMQKLECKTCLHSGSKSVSTGAIELFPDYTADPLYLRYIQRAHACAVYLYDRVKGAFSDGLRVESL